MSPQPLEDLVEVLAAVGADVEDGAEDFDLGSSSRPSWKATGATKLPLAGRARFADQLGALPVNFSMCRELARGRVDDRADVGVGLGRVADFELGERAGEERQDARRAPSSTKRMRCAEQRWPALWKAEITTSSTTCSGSAEGVDDHRVDAAGLGDERHDRAVALRQGFVDPSCGLHRAGKGDAGDARVGDERRADGFASPTAQQAASVGMPDS